MTRYLMFVTTLLLMISCRADQFIPKDEFVNSWWLMQDHDISFYLESPSNLTYWSFAEPYPTLQYNQQDGGWLRIGENKFEIAMFNDTWEVQAFKTEDNCYDLAATVFGWPVRDTACPIYVEDFETIELR